MGEKISDKEADDDESFEEPVIDYSQWTIGTRADILDSPLSTNQPFSLKNENIQYGFVKKEQKKKEKTNHNSRSKKSKAKKKTQKGKKKKKQASKKKNDKKTKKNNKTTTKKSDKKTQKKAS